MTTKTNVEPTRPDAVHPAASFSVTLLSIVDYDTVGQDLSQAPPATTTTNACARRVRANGAGNIKITYPNGHTDIVPFLAGETQDLQVRKITASGTTVSGLTLYW